jgi:hypothetical protein
MTISNVVTRFPLELAREVEIVPSKRLQLLRVQVMHNSIVFLCRSDLVLSLYPTNKDSNQSCRERVRAFFECCPMQRQKHTETKGKKPEGDGTSILTFSVKTTTRQKMLKRSREIGRWFCFSYFILPGNLKLI